MGKERGLGLDLHLDLEKPKNEALGNKSESQQPKATTKVEKENRQDKAGICSFSHFVEFFSVFCFWSRKDSLLIAFFFFSLISFHIIFSASKYSAYANGCRRMAWKFASFWVCILPFMFFKSFCVLIWVHFIDPQIYIFFQYIRFMSQVPPLPAGLVPVSGNPGSSNNLPVSVVILIYISLFYLSLSLLIFSNCYIAASIARTFTNSTS